MELETNSEYSDILQLEAAGFLEGALTAVRIYDHFVNTYAWAFSNGSVPAKVSDYFADQTAWVTKQTAGSYQGLSAYWQVLILSNTH